MAAGQPKGTIMRRGALLGVVMVVVAGACGGTTTAGPPTTGASGARSSSASDTTVAPPPNVTAELLTLSDMPTGWSVDNSTTSGESEPACLKPLKDHTGSDASATVSFNGNANGIPGIKEDLAHFPGGAAAALARFDAAISSCKTLTVTDAGQSYSGTIGAMSFPQIGDESHAYQASFDVKGFNLALDLIIARRGDTAMSLTYEDLGSPDLTQVQQFATTAMGRVTSA